MAIPLSALRRALAEMAERGGLEAELNYGLTRSSAGAGGLLGAVGGGAAGAAAQSSGDPNASAYPGLGMVAGAIAGGGLGGGYRLARIIGGGAQGAVSGLREALAEQAASRGMGRRAVREAADGEDAMRFFDASDPRSAQFLERMRSRHDELASQVSLPPRQRTELNELRALLESAGAQTSRATVRPQDANGIAAEIRQMATQPGEVEALVRQVSERDPVLGREVMTILMGAAPY